MEVQPSVSITEQPAGKQQRFRYLSEVDGARSVGSIPGVNSTPERKTFPSIRVHGYKGPFAVLLSLLNPDNNLVHPHSITGSDSRYTCRNGVIFVISEEPDVVFKNIGVLCVKGKTEKDVKSALKMRKIMGVDPFKLGFPHIDDHRRIDFTAVRLCFQVFLPGPDWTPADRRNLNKYTRALPAAVSDVIYDAKKLNDLKIVYINSCAGSTCGGNEMTLLCDKYTGQNPDVVFDDERGWTQTASVKMYHKQLAIVFVAPPYRDRNYQDRDNLKVKVYLQQKTERGELRSYPATVEYLPNDPKGIPLKFPSPPQSETSSISLKQIRILQRPSPGDPEDRHLKRWRPGGRRAPPDPSTTDSEDEHISSDRISQIYIRDLENTATDRTDTDERYKVIPLFDPNNPELQAHEWISTIDQLGNAYNWSDAVKAYYMQKRLTGIGKHWLSTLRHSDSWTWPQWKDKLLEAFHRKVDYVDLLKGMLAQRKTKSERVRFYNKNPLPARHEINAKKAYACLIEGWPLQMKTPTHYGHHESRHLLHPNYVHPLDRDHLQNNAPQTHPINLNKDEHMNAMNLHEDVKPIFPNIVNYRFDANSHDDHRRFCCCYKEKVRTIRHCPPSSQNEMRPSCIIQRHQRPLERSWHRPCSTFTSSSSSPSIANPVPDWVVHQLLEVTDCGYNDVDVGKTAVTTKMALVAIWKGMLTPRIPRTCFRRENAYEAPNYLGNKLNKGKSRGKNRNNNATITTAHYYAAPGTSSQAQPCGLNHDFKMSPLSCQEYSPSFETAEPDYSALNGYMDMLSTSGQMNVINVVHENKIVPDMNIHNYIISHEANVNADNINSLPSTSGVNNVMPDLKYRFSTIPSGTKVKREKCRGPDSGDLPSKRKHMPTELDALLYDVQPTYIDSIKPFDDANGPPLIHNEVPPPAACLLTGGENVDTCYQTLSSHVLDNFLQEDVNNINNIKAEDQWYLDFLNANPFVNQSLQEDHANLLNNDAHQILPDNYINIDHPYTVDNDNQASNHIECVSKEMGKMNVRVRHN